MKRITKVCIKQDVKQYKNDKIDEILNTTGSTKAIQKVTTSGKAWLNKLEDMNGEQTNNSEEVLDIATNFYKSLLSTTTSKNNNAIITMQVLTLPTPRRNGNRPGR